MRSFRKASKGFLLLPAFLISTVSFAQQKSSPPLFLVNEDTQVRSISFRFDSTRSIEESALQAQLATTEPSFADRIKKILPFLSPAPHPFSPLELQRDVARLRLYYRENGFPEARIGYAPSELDTTNNRISVVFTIDEGPPVLIREVLFFSTRGDPFPDPGEKQWETFRDGITIEPGDRYSLFERLETKNQALAWFKDNGYAFAQVTDTVFVDSTALTAEIRLTVDPGPMAYFDTVEVEGAESVGRNVVVRELPFKQGQPFSGGKLVQGQRELFALNLFRVALTELPVQPRDSTVQVLVRLREARPQLITYRAGYDRQAGLRLEGGYQHRNFSGGARTLNVDLVVHSGLGAAPVGDQLGSRLLRISPSIRQPYLFATQVSGTVAPYYHLELDPNLEPSDWPLGLNVQEMGLVTSVLYEVLPFRTVNFQHTFSRATLLGEKIEGGSAVKDRFNRSIFSISGTFGRSNDYINPQVGLLVRPAVEMAGRFLGSGVEYYKAAAEVTSYTELTSRTGLAGRVFVGRLWPTGDSRPQFDPVVENRFDPIRFYTGGGSDLRGWADQLAGPKTVRVDDIGGRTVYTYEPVGGLAKLAANAEVRLPFPGLGPNWGTAVFAGAGRVSEGNFSLNDFRYGTGVGIRYRTPVGFLRLDLAYKLNPDVTDLVSAETYYLEGEAAKGKWQRRFMLHLSIGQAY